MPVEGGTIQTMAKCMTMLTVKNKFKINDSTPLEPQNRVSYFDDCLLARVRWHKVSRNTEPDSSVRYVSCANNHAF